MYSADNLNSLIEFLTWLGIGERVGALPFCTSLVYSLGALCSFINIFTALYRSKKKNGCWYLLGREKTIMISDW